MTKRRPPVSPHGALSMIAGLIGWPAVAAAAKRSESAVRNWSDPDTTAVATFDSMLQLDTSFMQAGGDHRPFLNAFAAASDLEDARVGVEAAAIAEAAAVAVQESGQADAVTFLALQPGADVFAIELAEKEQTEAYEARGRVVQVLRAARERLRGRR